MQLLPRSRRFVQRTAIGAAQRLGAARRFVPFRHALKRVLGLHPPAPDPRETSYDMRLAAFVEARALEGGIDETGLEWLISRAPYISLALNYAGDESGRQIETALGVMGVAVSSDDAALDRALTDHAIVIFKSSDARLRAARRRADRRADLVIFGPSEDADGVLRLGAMTVLPARRMAEAA